MPEYEPLTKEERESVVMWVDWRFRSDTEHDGHDIAYWIRGYEATVAALEAEVKRLTPLAETGKAVEGMKRGYALQHTVHPDPHVKWVVLRLLTRSDADGEPHGASPLAALAAAKGDGDDAPHV